MKENVSSIVEKMKKAQFEYMEKKAEKEFGEFMENGGHLCLEMAETYSRVMIQNNVLTIKTMHGGWTSDDPIYYTNESTKIKYCPFCCEKLVNGK